jgi:Spy/CpxP family protein refolding chaperone
VSKQQKKDHKPKGESKMRTRIIAAMIALMFVTVASVSIYAQAPKGNMNKKGMMKGHMMGGNMMKGKIFEKLNLTDAQKGQMAKLRTDFQTKMVDLKANLQKDKIALKALRNKDDVTRDEVIASVEAVNKSRDAISVAMANHLMDVRDILTPEQRKIAKEHLSGMLMGMREHGMMGHSGWNKRGNK